MKNSILYKKVLTNVLLSFIARLMNIRYELIIFHPAVYFFVKGRRFPLNIDWMLVPLPRSLVFF
ncbi:hypothetical protein ACFWMS_03420 [Peribacillus butanolivorans]|uniref:Uncharacterized protein n=1 Tax=Peribacillus butanolivorans TaxID=421767 RepID=A0ABM6XG71_9BACI|nr:hypothetical protein DTO10_01875 [Peribacillus butanolivorans]KQU20449.1 hypothetical protein ASG65_05230 [Bacillus sp. Leaf13]